MQIDKIIQEKLSKKEIHQLLSLCKKYFPLPLHVLDGQEEFIKGKEKAYMGKRFFQKILEIRKIHNLYKKAEISEADYLVHWTIQRSIQRKESDKYNISLKPERKDNKTYLNRGSGHSNRNQIRYPKKARKTAWKRFYKLFPHLDPERNKKLNEELTML
jgi:hypothetical protein